MIPSADNPVLHTLYALFFGIGCYVLIISPLGFCCRIAKKRPELRELKKFDSGEVAKSHFVTKHGIIVAKCKMCLVCSNLRHVQQKETKMAKFSDFHSTFVAELRFALSVKLQKQWYKPICGINSITT